ncbi:STAS domain-containing protein [Thermomonospora echinospora]|nr:STAS domain-containing protein [Thermomonospora echinospora]
MLLQTYLAASAEPDFDVTVHSGEAGLVIARIRGELDLATADRLHRLVHAAMSSGRRARVLLDLGGVTFCDAQGLSALVRIANDAQGGGGELSLTRIPPVIARLLRLTGLDHRFPVTVVAMAVPQSFN